jgi:phage terminase large subunit
MPEITIPHNFYPRDYQLKFLKAMDSGVKRALLVWHRRSGKDLTTFNWVIKQLMIQPSICYYIFPTYSQAKKAIWDSKDINGRPFLDYIPKEIIESKHQQEMKIKLINGSMFQMVGSDNIDSIMGTNPKIVVFSEYAMQTPQAWDYIRPILRVNGGVAIFISTPRGKNHFYDLYNHVKNSSDWFVSKCSIDDTLVLTKEDMDIERSEGMSDELIEQEFYVSFDKGVEGAYYGKLIEKARNEARICSVSYDTRSPVHTAWDIGFGDSTSIVFWQEIGGEFRVIDFYENQGEGIAHYVKQLQSKTYVYGTHYMPHDAGSGSIQTGRTVQDIAYEIGLKATVLERESDIQVGIEAVRSLLSIAYIDEKKCGHLIKCLENYHKKFNEKTNYYSESPLHDWSSHAADAVRYMANARIQYGRGPGSLTPEQLNKIKMNAGFGPKSQPKLGPQHPFTGNNDNTPYSFRR